MKMPRPVKIIALLLLTQSLHAADRGGGVGFALPTRQPANPPVPQVAPPAVPTNRARTVARPRRNFQPGNPSQRSATTTGQVRRGQNQDQTNSRNSVAASPRQDRHERHDRDWWKQHYRTIVFVLGGYYFWDGGYWYPALGYDPNYTYDSDGPIYAYGNLLPDQVIANVQAQLKVDGYYLGPIDGSLDPATQAAIANYQRDHGLLVTATVDQSTVESLGLA
jgi:hypothetical protein